LKKGRIPMNYSIHRYVQDIDPMPDEVEDRELTWLFDQVFERI
jgi:hypothetical protein